MRQLQWRLKFEVIALKYNHLWGRFWWSIWRLRQPQGKQVFVWTFKLWFQTSYDSHRPRTIGVEGFLFLSLLWSRLSSGRVTEADPKYTQSQVWDSSQLINRPVSCGHKQFEVAAFSQADTRLMTFGGWSFSSPSVVGEEVSIHSNYISADCSLMRPQWITQSRACLCKVC